MRVFASNNSWRLRAWRCLVSLGCAVLLFGQSLPNPSAPLPLPLPLSSADPESEHESAPVSDDDDEAEAVPSLSTLRCQRFVRVTCLSVIPVNWLVHLPHHHCGQSGFRLPPCTPFERDCALLPLRC